MEKLFKWIGIALLVFVALPIVVVVAINLFDEDLDPKAAAYGAPRSASVPESENAYFAVIALNASDGANHADSLAYARSWHNEVRAASTENRKEALPESKRAKRPELCDSWMMACLALIREKAGEVAQRDDAYKEDLVRYDTLLGYKRYEDVIDFPMREESSSPPFIPLYNAQRANFLRVGLGIQAGKLEEGVAALERDFAFQRMLLGSSRVLPTRAAAATRYWRGLQFLSELMRLRSTEIAPYLPRVRELLKPLDATALSLVPVIEREFGFEKEALRIDKVLKGNSIQTIFLGGYEIPVGRFGVRLFYKPNATLNRAYRSHLDAAAWLSASANRVEEEWGIYVRRGGEFSMLPHWDDFYNPVGKFATSIGVSVYRDYPLRLHDLDALNRMLALRVEMLIAGIGPEKAPDFIAKSDARFHNPYTRKPMDWDAENKRIYFEAHSSAIKRLKQGVEGGKVFVAF